MKVTVLAEAITAASQIREKCVKVATCTTGRKYCPPREICGEENLGNWCGIASRALSMHLTKRGIRNKLIFGYFNSRSKGTEAFGNHCWVIVGSNIIDITATQFGDFPSVHVVPRNNWRYEEENVIENPEEFFACWGGQRPSKRILKEIEETA